MSEPWKEEQSRQEDMERWAKSNLPQCEDCEDFIYDYGYKIGHKWYCEDCMRKHYKEVVVDGE